MILVVAEQRDGRLNRATLETIAAAQTLAGAAPITVAVFGAAAKAAGDLAGAAGVSEVLTVEHPALDVYTPDGEPFDGDPRAVLKRQLARAEEMGYVFQTGPELEFFLLRTSGPQKVEPLPHDQAGYFDVTTDLAADVRKEKVAGQR